MNQAIAACEDRIADQNERLDLYLAQALRDKIHGNPAVELAVIDEAVKEFAANAEALRTLAEHTINSDFSKAIQIIGDAAGASPDSPIYRSELASLLYLQKQFRRANREALQCIKMEERFENREMSGRELYYLGLAYHIVGQKEVASYILKRACLKDRNVGTWEPYGELMSR